MRSKPETFDGMPERRTWFDILLDDKNSLLCGTVTAPSEEIANAVAAALIAKGYAVSIRKFIETKSLWWEHRP